jgi:L,D-peptidoglycan transpeptidase YkuD (ErfK/YbiS/YcfS/YnhG family)
MGTAMAVCALVACSAPVSFRGAATAAAAPPAAVDGPCHSLGEGLVAYDTGDAQRVTFAIADRYRETAVVLTSCVQVPGGYAQEWQATGFTGSGGFGRSGDVLVDSLETPTGSFTVTEAFGRKDPGTALEYHELNELSRWGGRPGEHFNQYFEGKGALPDENLWQLMEEGLYEQAAVINYNRLPDMTPEAGLSYAIFLHAGMSESWGCISTDLGTVTRFLKTAVPGDRFVMGVDHKVFLDTSITGGIRK